MAMHSLILGLYRKIEIFKSSERWRESRRLVLTSMSHPLFFIILPFQRSVHLSTSGSSQRANQNQWSTNLRTTFLQIFLGSLG